MQILRLLDYLPVSKFFSSKFVAYSEIGEKKSYLLHPRN